MRPPYLSTFTTCHLQNGIIRFFTYDLTYSLGELTCKLSRTINAIEDFFMDECFQLRPFFACDTERGMLHIKVMHTHFVIQPKGYRDEYERRLQNSRPDGLSDSEK